jgi:hypothetical protein
MLIKVNKVIKDKNGEQVIKEDNIHVSSITRARKWEKGKMDEGIDGEMTLVEITKNNKSKRILIAEDVNEFTSRLSSI